MDEKDALKTKEKAPEESGKTSDEMRELAVTANKKVKRYQLFLIRVFVILLIIWALFFIVLGITHMPSNDMHPRIDGGDMLLFYRLDKTLKAQDVVIIEKKTPLSGNNKNLYVSRVIAVEGDTVDIDENGQVIVNERTMIEPDIFYATRAYEGYQEFPVTLGAGECFVLADARNEGTDSRFFGPVKVDEIKGTVITVVRRNNL